MGLKLHQSETLPKVGEWNYLRKSYCNTFRDNSSFTHFVGEFHGSETSPSESSPKSR